MQAAMQAGDVEAAQIARNMAHKHEVCTFPKGPSTLYHWSPTNTKAHDCTIMEAAQIACNMAHKHKVHEAQFSFCSCLS